jgi:hypothetical protein
MSRVNYWPTCSRLEGSLGGEVDRQDARLDAVLHASSVATSFRRSSRPVTSAHGPYVLGVDLLHRFTFQTSSRAGGASGAAAGSPRELSVRSATSAAAARKMLAASNARV